MRLRREAEEPHARDYEEGLHDLWKADDSLCEQTDRRYAERVPRNEEEVARTNQRADADRR